MTLALWCVLIAGLLPYAATLLAKSDKSFDNADPRGWLSKQSGWRARANAAQQNSFEALPLFAAAVIIAHYLQAPQHTVNLLALVFVAARLLYIGMYVFNRATLRSLCWTVGIGCVVGLFVISA